MSAEESGLESVKSAAPADVVTNDSADARDATTKTSPRATTILAMDFVTQIISEKVSGVRGKATRGDQN